MGGIQDRMAEVRDLEVNLGCDGAEGGSKVINSLLHNTSCRSKQVFACTVQIWTKTLSLCGFLHYI